MSNPISDIPLDLATTSDIVDELQRRGVPFVLCHRAGNDYACRWLGSLSPDETIAILQGAILCVERMQ